MSDSRSATRSLAKALAAVAQRTPSTIHVNMPTVKIGDRLRIVAMQLTTVEGVEPSFTAIVEPPEMLERLRRIETVADSLVSMGYDEFTFEQFEALRDAVGR